MIKKGVYAAGMSILRDDMSLDVDSTITHAEKIIKTIIIKIFINFLLVFDNWLITRLIWMCFLAFKAHGIANRVPYISEIWLNSAAHIVGDKKKYLAITSYESIKPAKQNNQAESHAI